LSGWDFSTPGGHIARIFVEAARHLSASTEATESPAAKPVDGGILAALLNRHQMEIVVKGAGVGVWYCPLPFDKLIWDEKVKEHFHLPASAVVTIEGFYDRLHPDDRDRGRRAMEISIEQKQPYDIDYRTVSPDGQHEKWIRASGRGFYDADGKPLRFDGITIDITDRVRAQHAHRKIAAELEQHVRVVETVMSSITDFAYTLDRQGKFVYVNKPLLDLWGLQLKDAVGKDFFELKYPPDLAAKLQQQIQQVFETKASLSDETPYTSPTGATGFYEYIFSPVLDADGTAILVAGCTRDITERKMLLEAERSARADAERAGRLKDEFLATLSHELRTPMNAILGWSQILTTGGGSNHAEDLEEGLRTIERNARAQAKIIEDLLDMSRIISGKVRLDIQQVDLGTIAQAAVATARPAAEAKGIRILSAIDPMHDLTVNADSNRLQQVLWNLLSNAVKFTPRGGRIELRAERVESHLQISVADTGQGIKPEFLPYVFDRFRQADASITRRHGGLGLGLSIVKQLVEMHGGSIYAQSAGPGLGSTFVVLLPPTTVQEPLELPDPSHPSRQASGLVGLVNLNVDLTGVHVLVVDDEPDARALVKRLLEDSHAAVTTAGSAEEALKLLQDTKFDVLVSDIGMPNEDGYALIRRVRSLGKPNSEIPAIALTAYARAEDRVKAISASFQMHVTKPVEPVELITMVAGAAGKMRVRREQ
jgi:PAS domain S-box-containing protein